MKGEKSLKPKRKKKKRKKGAELIEIQNKTAKVNPSI